MIRKILKKRIILPLTAVIIVITSSAFQNNFFEIAKQIEIFTSLYKEVNMNYVDETNPAQLMNAAITNMLDELDPYTRFMNEQDVEDAQINNIGDYTGIGARVRTQKDKLVIIEPYKNYPADKAGLKAGDEIIKIDDVLITNIDEADDLLKGSPGTNVTVTYNRQGKTNTATIEREAVEIKAVPHFSMLNEKIGYIVLHKFNQKASAETAYALKDLKLQGATSIILDLRDNPGGLLTEAINIVNLFVPKGQLVVTTKSAIEKYNKTYYTQHEPIDTQIPIVVLINGRSASASEIVSGALQDLDRAVIVGNRSFGKGLVQRPKELAYGTHLRITISRYYTPSGRCIQALDYWDRDEKGDAVRIKKEDYNTYKTKGGRIVYDGGGILPDAVVGTTSAVEIINALEENFIFFDYATKYYYANPSININNFSLSDSDFEDFKNYLNQNNFTFETQTEKALKKVMLQAKKESLDEAIQNEYNALLKSLDQSKNQAIVANKDQILKMLTNEIVTRYVYREGLYDYLKEHNTEIQKAADIIGNPSKYSSYLN